MLSSSLAIAVNTFAGDTPSPIGAKAFILAPKHGEIDHLLIDTGVPDLSIPIPADDKHKHFGGGQTETTIELTSGPHTLQILLGDAATKKSEVVRGFSAMA